MKSTMKSKNAKLSAVVGITRDGRISHNSKPGASARRLIS
jgi:hypothetical protein